jgi:hypothetical protein
VELLRNGAVYRTETVSADWSFTFGNLLAFDKAGVLYVYTVKEKTVIPGVDASVSGTTITNTYRRRA